MGTSREDAYREGQETSALERELAARSGGGGGGSGGGGGGSWGCAVQILALPAGVVVAVAKSRGWL